MGSSTLLKLTLISAVVFLVCELVDSSAILNLQMISYKNANEHDWHHKCCDGLCFQSCDHKFVFCLDRGNSLNTDPFYCPIGKYSTNAFPEKNINYFDQDMHGVQNPIQQKIDTWEGAYFKINVMDHDSGLNGDDLVDKLYHRFDDTPARSRGLASFKTKVIVGTRDQDPTSFSFKYLVYCENNYFGGDCATYCVAKDDDRNGHYTCNPYTGAKICRTGWEDPETNCRRWWDDCEHHACWNGGSCIDAVQNYTCECPPDFTGSQCEYDIRDCRVTPCQNGYCMETMAVHRCVCPDGYGGASCQFHICEEDSGHCQNGGTCYGIGQCHCPEEFTGSSCEINRCDPNPCENDGICYNGECTCKKGFEGSRCDVDACKFLACENGGQCLQGICVCPMGYTGKHCHLGVDDCVDAPCQHEGMCVDRINGYQCECLPAFTGMHCESEVVITWTDNNHNEDNDQDNNDDNDLDEENTQHASEQRGDAQPVNAAVQALPNWIIILIVLLALLILVIVIVAALLIKYKRRAQKAEAENAQSGNDGAAASNFTNPLYTPEAMSNIQYQRQMSCDSVGTVCTPGGAVAMGGCGGAVGKGFGGGFEKGYPYPVSEPPKYRPPSENVYVIDGDSAMQDGDRDSHLYETPSELRSESLYQSPPPPKAVRGATRSAKTGSEASSRTPSSKTNELTSGAHGTTKSKIQMFEASTSDAPPLPKKEPLL